MERGQARYHPGYLDYGGKYIGQFGSLLQIPWYGGVRLLVPPSAGIPASYEVKRNAVGKYRPSTASHEATSALLEVLKNPINADPLAQEVYGNLVSMGHPVYGPNFEDVYGKPGIIGFGKR